MTLIKNMRESEPFDGFYLIKSAEVRKTKAGKDYLALTVQDSSGSISGNLWSVNPTAVKQFVPGVVVHIAGVREVYNNTPQINQLQIRLTTALEPSDAAEYREKSPVKEADLREYVQSIVFQIENATWNRVVRHILGKFDKEFYQFPAAKSNHHAFYGGLAFHETTMVRLAEKIADVYPQLNRSLLFAGILLHDLAKCLEFSGYEDTSYTLRGNLVGHIVLMDEEITKAAIELDIPDENEDLLLLRHVVLSHHGLLEYGSPVEPQLMEAEVVHQIDMMDASMMMMTTALSSVEAGQQSAKIWPLENRMFYKPEWLRD